MLALAGSVTAAETRSAASADLAVLVGQAPSTGAVGAKLLISFGVENLGPDSAGGVLKIELPPSFRRTVSDSFTISPSKCVGEPVVECTPDLGVWLPRTSPSVPVAYFGIWVRPTQPGTFTIKASLTSDVPDPNPANNEIAATITVSPMPTLTATVGPGSVVSLKSANGSRVKTTRAGSYTIVVRDRSAKDNFHLTGSGVSVRTGVPFRGTRTFKVDLKVRETYRYRSDAHPKLGGSFRAT